MMKDEVNQSNKSEIHFQSTQDPALYRAVQGQYYIHPSGLLTVRQTEGCDSANPSDTACLDRIHAIEDSSRLSSYYAEHAFVPDVSINPQGPTYTGYPVSMMSFHGSIPYAMESVYYPCMNVDSSLVDIQSFDGYMPAAFHCANVDSNVSDMQPYYGATPGGHHQFDTGVSVEYVHNNNGCIPFSQYQPSPIGQYVVSSPPSPEGVVTVQEDSGSSGFISTSYAYYPPVGTLMPVYMSSPMVDGPVPLSCEPFLFSHPLVIPCSSPSILRATAPDWIQQPSKLKVSQKGEVIGSVQLNGNQGHSDYHHPLKTKPVVKPSSFSAIKETEHEDARKMVTTPATAMPVQNKEPKASHLGPYQQSGALVHPINSTNGDAMRSPRPSEQPSALDNAKYFIIKSFNEANIYKSIQHGVWSSTPNGNKKLDQAFKDAQSQAKAKGSECPIFLFFSVNGSGRFCGVAEMLGCLDYDKTMEFWEENKWSGSFEVKWHIIKDVPNSLFRKIILPNNENKPVTSSRDTQEVNCQQGQEMLEIYRSYPMKTSIVDAFKDASEVSAHESKGVQPSSSSQVCNESEPFRELGLRSKESPKCNTLRACTNAEQKPKDLCQPKSFLVRVDPACNSHCGRKTDKENMMIGSTQPMPK